MSKDDTVLIPLEKLQQGFDLCKKQMETLIESSEILHNSKLYTISIALLVLAREESAKLELIHHHLAWSSGINKKTWNSITKGFVHQHKLVNPVKFGVDFATAMGKDLFDATAKWGREQGYEPVSASYEDFMKVNESDYQRLSSLNEIKKECFYLDWKNSTWKLFLNRPKAQLEAISLVELINMKYLFYGFIIGDLQFKEKNEKIAKELELVKEKRQQIIGFRKTKQFKIKKTIAWSVHKEFF